MPDASCWKQSDVSSSSVHAGPLGACPGCAPPRSSQPIRTSQSPRCTWILWRIKACLRARRAELTAGIRRGATRSSRRWWRR
eukprot:3059274-Pleurochrysis_carterae.AAC.3